MFNGDEAQYAIFKQTAIGAIPGSPDGRLIPRSSGFSAKHDQNKVDNPQIFSDGYTRQPGLGNHTSEASGDIATNLNALPFFYDGVCSGVASTPAFDGIYQINVTNGGSGYNQATPPTVTITGGAGAGAVAKAVVDVNGQVVAVVIENSGAGFTGAPTIGFTGGGGAGAAATAVIDNTKTKHTGIPKAGNPVLYLLEKTPAPSSTLYRRYYDMVVNKFGISIPIEGMLVCSTGLVGSGRFDKSGTPIDATLTEMVGTPVEFANLLLLESGVASACISDLQFNLDLTVREKRTHNGKGRATQMRRGKSMGTVTITAHYEDEVLAAKAEAGTLISILGQVYTPDGRLDISAPEIWVKPTDWQSDDEGGATITFEGELIKKTHADSPFRLTVLNGNSTP